MKTGLPLSSIPKPPIAAKVPVPGAVPAMPPKVPVPSALPSSALPSSALPSSTLPSSAVPVPGSVPLPSVSLPPSVPAKVPVPGSVPLPSAVPAKAPVPTALPPASVPTKVPGSVPLPSVLPPASVPAKVPGSVPLPSAVPAKVPVPSAVPLPSSLPPKVPVPSALPSTAVPAKVPVPSAAPLPSSLPPKLSTVLPPPVSVTKVPSPKLPTALPPSMPISLPPVSVSKVPSPKLPTALPPSIPISLPPVSVSKVPSPKLSVALPPSIPISLPPVTVFKVPSPKLPPVTTMADLVSMNVKERKEEVVEKIEKEISDRETLIAEKKTVLVGVPDLPPLGALGSAPIFSVGKDTKKSSMPPPMPVLPVPPLPLPRASVSPIKGSAVELAKTDIKDALLTEPEATFQPVSASPLAGIPDSVLSPLSQIASPANLPSSRRKDTTPKIRLPNIKSTPGRPSPMTKSSPTVVGGIELPTETTIIIPNPILSPSALNIPKVSATPEVSDTMLEAIRKIDIQKLKNDGYKMLELKVIAGSLGLSKTGNKKPLTESILRKIGEINPSAFTE